MKVIRIDNFDREYYPDKLIADGLTEEEAQARAAEENANCSEEYYYKVVEDDYKMFGGFEP